MDRTTNPPLGLTVLVAATVILTAQSPTLETAPLGSTAAGLPSPPAAYISAYAPAGNRLALEVGSHGLRQYHGLEQYRDLEQYQGQVSDPAPRFARLMLRVESLFQPTTAN